MGKGSKDVPVTTNTILIMCDRDYILSCLNSAIHNRPSCVCTRESYMHAAVYSLHMYGSIGATLHGVT